MLIMDMLLEGRTLENRIILTTSDGGTHWNQKSSQLEDYDLLSVYVTNNGHGFAVGLYGYMFVSNDNGNTWTKQFSGSGSGEVDIYSIYFVNEHLGFAVGYKNNWSAGYVILKTTNSGRNWSIQNSTDYRQPLYSVFFTDELHGWALGLDGIYQTTDSGEVWSLLNSNFPGNSVFFLDQNIGFIAGQKIYKTYDGGKNWIEKSRIGGNSVYFSNPDTGWVVGENGSIQKSCNGGETWVAKPSNTNESLKCIKFFDSNIGMCVGTSGTILLSTDCGETWVTKNCISADELSSITFTSSGMAWVCGSDGTIVSSKDFGDKWTIFDNATNNDLNTINFTNNNSGWVGGENGTILKYYEDSSTPVELTSFNASKNTNSVILNWETATETNNKGFEIQKKTAAEFSTIGFVDGQGTSTNVKNYKYMDYEIQPGQVYYRIKQIDFDGNYSYSNEVTLMIDYPVMFELNQNYPNPFNPTTKISFNIPYESNVKLVIYNLLGEKVKQLLDNNFKAGTYEINFDASDLSSGVYLYRIEAGTYTDTKKMILMR